jgi:hypothetical protein
MTKAVCPVPNVSLAAISSGDTQQQRELRSHRNIWKWSEFLMAPLRANSHAVSPLSPYPSTASGFKTVPRAHRFITQFLTPQPPAHVLTWSTSDITALWPGNKSAAFAPYEHTGFTASFRGIDHTNKSNSRWCAEFGGSDMIAGFCGDRRR